MTNPDGQVYPCCYFANMVYVAENMTAPIHRGHQSQMEHPVMKAYTADKEEYNVMHDEAHEILQKKWFSKTLPESWESDSDRHFLCIKHCEHDE